MSSHPAHELATVINNFLPTFNTENKLPAYKLRTLNALQKCRTGYMGGHIETCEDCGEVRVAYNSCRNRHCPKCGAIEKEKWIMSREADLLPVKYFHVVFTVPGKLNSLFLNSQVAMYNLLFSVVWDVMKGFGKTKQWIGGLIGAMAILHTSGQNLNYHPHLHLIVPAGALMPNGKCEAKQIINYLSRYTHRTAISNDRIINVDGKNVTFTWKDYKNNYAKQTTKLPGEKFLQLFCMHILPPGFTRIRHYGFLSSASKRKSLALIRSSLNVTSPCVTTKKPWQEIAFERMGIQPGICRCCGGKMIITITLPNRFVPGKRAPPEKKISKFSNYSMIG